MVQYSNLERVMEARDHFKNGVSSKNLTSSGNFKIIQTFSKMTMIVLIAMLVVGTINAQTEQNTQQAVQPIVVMDSINTLAEAIKPLHGKKIYIDIWATWCKPCLMEFAHNEALKKILAENDIQQLYISLDNENKTWIDFININQYNFTGTHIRANNGLLGSDLLKLFFTNAGGGIELSIPRYILIDEKGNIVEEHAKRPSQIVLGEKLW